MKKLKIIMLIVTLLLTSMVISHPMMASEPDAREIYVVTAIFNSNMNMEWEFLETDAAAFFSDDVAMVPLRAIAETFGYHVEHQANNNSIIITDATARELVLHIGSTDVMVDGEFSAMNQAPVVRGGRTFVPVRYVSEFFGLYVTWHPSFTGSFHSIWLSEVEHLTDDDIMINSSNYMKRLDHWGEDPSFGFLLLDQGYTVRGVSIGDSLEQVISAYGPAHITDYVSYYDFKIRYFHVLWPDGGVSFYKWFDITNGKVSGSGVYMYRTAWIRLVRDQWYADGS